MLKISPIPSWLTGGEAAAGRVDPLLRGGEEAGGGRAGQPGRPGAGEGRQEGGQEAGQAAGRKSRHGAGDSRQGGSASDLYPHESLLRSRIHRIQIFLGLLDPGPNPSIIKQK